MLHDHAVKAPVSIGKSVASVLLMVFPGVLPAEQSEHILHPHALPELEQLSQWTAEMVKLSENDPEYRRTGSASEKKTLGYITQKLNESGLENVSQQTFKTSVYHYQHWQLSTNDTIIPSYFMSGSAFIEADSGLTGDLIYFKDSIPPEANLTGKIVLVDLSPGSIETSYNKTMASYIFDPKNTIKNGNIGGLAGATPGNFPAIYYQAVQNKAAAIIAILTAYNTCKFYPDERASVTPRIPGLFISADNGKKLLAMISSSSAPVSVNLKVTGMTRESESSNLIVTLPGQSKETILLSTHYDSGFHGAVQSISGVAVLMGLAKYYHQFPSQQLKKNLIFTFYSGHLSQTGSRGSETFVRAHHNLIRDIVLAFDIQHIGKEFKTQGQRYIDSGDVEPRLFFLPANTLLFNIAKQAVQQNNFHDTLFIRPGYLSLPVTAQALYLNSVPVFSLTSLPEYLYLENDTLDKIAFDQYLPTIKTIATIINQALDLPGSWLKHIDNIDPAYSR